MSNFQIWEQKNLARFAQEANERMLEQQKEIEQLRQAFAASEQNFCSRCGKRTRDLTTIHTCTPPQENT